ncbi:putative LPS assembly protein LptD, partial [Rubrivirga sp.]|uniref:putative LPS assembly protein LptD n=1 Tax=Rubrivirga sp. TaxID=1885344 RepID=UPI003C715F07
GRSDKWYETISLEYSANAQNAFEYAPLEDETGISALDALFSPSAFQQGVCPADDPLCDATRFDYSVTQRVPISAQFNIRRFNLAVSPSLLYSEGWAGERAVRAFEGGRIVETSDPGFTAVRRLAASLSASTELYGTFPIRVGALDGLRHTVSPRVSMSFEPDYRRFGFVQEVQADSLGATQRYAITPVLNIPIQPQATLGLTINNAFVARTVRTDSTGEESRSTRQVFAFTVSSGYNFVADRAPISPVNASFNTDLFGVSANGNARFSAYAPDTTLTQTPLTYFESTGRPVRLTQFGIRLGRTFRTSRQSAPRDERPVFESPASGAQYDPRAIEVARAPVGYLDYSAPWSAAVGVTLNRSALGNSGDAVTTATLRVSQFNARLTPNWSISGSSGLDLTDWEITQTRLSLRRDLHCWEMAINWQPIGQTKSFSVSLYVKSGLLRDVLRLDVPRSTVRPSVFGSQF